MGFKRKLCRWALFKLLGWRVHISVPVPEKCILCVAPHTSNVDLLIGMLFCQAQDMHIRFLMKREWFFWPLKYLWWALGGIAVNREQHSALVSLLVEEAHRQSLFRLIITPEGTRSANPNWRRGFYYIAQGAGIPILLVGMDYRKRQIVIEREEIPSGNIEEKLADIKQYFCRFAGLHPDRFAI